MYPAKDFTVLAKTSKNPFSSIKTVLIPTCGLLTQMKTLKCHLPPLSSSKSHKYDNYDKAPYIVFCYLQFYKAKFFATQFS